LKEYEEQKAEREKKEKAEKEKAEKTGKANEPKPAVEAASAGQMAEEEFSEDGMMAGVGGHGKGKLEEKKPPLPVTTWGRYSKVLLSSSEFLFVN